MIDPEKLAEAARAFGMRCDDMGGCVHAWLYDPHAAAFVWIRWNPEVGESPVLLVAMLDLLDGLRDSSGNRIYLALGATPNHIKGGASVPREDGLTHYCGSHYGRSRTEAVANALIAAHSAGLSPKGEME